MVQPIFTSLPPPDTKKICFKRIKRRGWYKLKRVKRRGWYKLFDWTKTTRRNQTRYPGVTVMGLEDRTKKKKSVVAEEELKGVWDVVTDVETDWVCETLWSSCKSTHRWTSSIFIMSTPFEKSKLYVYFWHFSWHFRAFPHSTYTHVLAVLDSELAQMLWHAFDTYTVATHSRISSTFIMSTPSSRSKVYTLFLAFLWHFCIQRTLAYWAC